LEAFANGRLAGRENGPSTETLASGGATDDAAALAAALHQPGVTIVLSGAVTGDELASNLRAGTLTIDPPDGNAWQCPALGTG
jgi:aryl-alcohol dehydrogenase-like predicted oxidoreductase